MTQLEEGMTFKSKLLEDFRFKIQSIDEEENSLCVEIIRVSNHNYIESWNLQETIRNIEIGEYILVP